MPYALLFCHFCQWEIFFFLRWNCVWEDTPFVLFFHLLTLSSQPSSSPHLTLQTRWKQQPQPREEAKRGPGAGQTRLGDPGPLTVKAGYGVRSWLHGPGRKARHSAWKSGQTGGDLGAKGGMGARREFRKEERASVPEAHPPGSPPCAVWAEWPPRNPGS